MTGSDTRPLVAVVLPRAEAARAVVGCWEAGEAVLPLDPLAPRAALAGALQAARPTHLLDGTGRTARDGGEPAQAGVAAVVATSGTMGAPKVVELTAEGIRASALASSAAIGAGPDDRWLCCVPVASVAGLAVVARAWHTGAALEVHDRFDVQAVASARRVTLVSLVAIMLRRLLAAGADLGHLRCLLLGGGPVPAGLPERAAARGARVVATYGLTETFGGVVHDGHPLAGVELSIRQGEICVRGPMVMRGYRGAPELTAAALAGGVLHTGDLGRLEPDGRLVVEGRRDDLIKTGGVSVQPHEVEAVLAAHPAVADVAVRGRPDPEWGERIVAYVVPCDGAGVPSLGGLRAFAGEHLPAAKLPRQVVGVAAIPRTASGKILRRLLGQAGDVAM